MASNAERQRKLREKRRVGGIVQCNVWVPASQVPVIQQMAEMMCANHNLTINLLLDASTGRRVSMKTVKSPPPIKHITFD